MPSLSLMLSSVTEREKTDHGPKLDSSDVFDRLSVMRHQEETIYIVSDYLNSKKTSSTTASPSYSNDWTAAVGDREKMTEWCYQVNDYCSFKRETVAIGMSYLDRFMATPAGSKALRDRKMYQLACTTTLYMAIKLFERLSMETSTLSEISRGCYTEADFVEMESTILHELKWHMHGPTAASFVNHIFTLLPKDVEETNATLFSTILDCVLYQTEIAVFDYNLVTQNASTIAIAAIQNVLEASGSHFLTKDALASFYQSIEAATRTETDSVDIQGVRLMLCSAFSANNTGGCLSSSVKSILESCSTNKSSSELALEDKMIIKYAPILHQKCRMTSTSRGSPVSVMPTGQ